jgi:integrase
MALNLESGRRSKQRWPFVKQRTYGNGTTSWMVDARTKAGGERKTFETKAEAETFADECRIRRGNEGTAAFGNDELARRGKTVADAIAYFLAHLRREEASVTTEAALAELVTIKKAAGRSVGYCKNLEQRIGRFIASHPQTSVASFTTKQIDDWLAGLRLAPGTRNTFRRDLRTLFSFCEKRGYCPTNEARKTERAKEVDKKPEILTVAESEALLNACSPDVLPFVAISMFAGLRASEAQQLDWAEVDILGGFIEVTSAKSKTRKRRLVNISKNLSQIIAPHASDEGLVAPVGLRKRLDAVKEKAGLSDWKPNALRHGFASYHLAKNKDAAGLALEMGNSPTMIFAHYRELVVPSEAAKFWELLPSSQRRGKVGRHQSV